MNDTPDPPGPTKPGPADPVALSALAADIRAWGTELGFDRIAITDTDLGDHPAHLRRWLAAGYHGAMGYLERNLDKRQDPARLEPGTARVIVARMNYLPEGAQPSQAVLDDPGRGFIARYALGRDYHKTVRRRLARLADRIRHAAPFCGLRAFTDSAPVLEKAFGEKAGLGWIGKHSLLLDEQDGSYFFLGEILTSLPLPVDQPAPRNHCGSCRACIDVCPTDAIVAPGVLDARRCIAYLTIEHKGAIPEELRPLLGNRIFGCDDCQMVCPHNRRATFTREADFAVRHELDNPSLLALFTWDEAAFLKHTEGSALRRISYSQWRRNLAVALGNHPPDPAVREALRDALATADDLAAMHITWALERQEQRQKSGD